MRRFRVTGADGRVLFVEAMDWMMAMVHVINHLDIEVSGWMCDTKPNGEVHVADPVHGHAWIVTPDTGRTVEPPRSTAPAPLPAAAEPAPAQPPAVAPPPPSVRPRGRSPRWMRESRPPAGEDLSVRHTTEERPRRRPTPAPVAAEPASRPAQVEESAPDDLAERLFDLSFDISEAASANGACQRALGVVLELVPCEAGSVARGSLNHDVLTFVAASGPAADKIIGRKVRYGQGLIGVAFDLGVAIQVNDVEDDPRHLSAVDRETGFETRTVLCVPVRTETTFYGAIELLNPPTRFLPWHQEVAETIAHTLASRLAGDA